MAPDHETARLILERPTSAHILALFGFLGDGEAMQHTQWDADEAACAARLMAHEAQRARIGVAPWSVRTKEDRRIIGWGGLCEDPFDPGWGVELIYAFAPDVWGRGYGHELARKALDLAAHAPGLDTVSAFARPANVASVALLRAVGFRRQRYVATLDRDLFVCRTSGQQML